MSIQEIIDICNSVPEQSEGNQHDDALNDILKIAKELSKDTEILDGIFLPEGWKQVGIVAEKKDSGGTTTKKFMF